MAVFGIEEFLHYSSAMAHLGDTPSERLDRMKSGPVP
jgi:hypothetical protein